MQNNEELLNIEFEKYWNVVKNEIPTNSIKEIAKMFFMQGHVCDVPVGKELSKEEFEDLCFMSFVKDCIEHPENMVNQMEQTDFVEVTAPCGEQEKCIAFPDRCEDAGCEAPGVCRRYINISKLCGVEDAVVVNRKDILSKKEIDALAEALAKARGE